MQHRTSASAVDSSLRVRVVRAMTKREIHAAVKLDLPLCRPSAVEAGIRRLQNTGEIVRVTKGPHREQPYLLAKAVQ